MNLICDGATSCTYKLCPHMKKHEPYGWQHKKHGTVKCHEAKMFCSKSKHNQICEEAI